MKKILSLALFLVATWLNANALKPVLANFEEADLSISPINLNSQPAKVLSTPQGTAANHPMRASGKSGLSLQSASSALPFYADEYSERLDSTLSIYVDGSPNQKEEFVYDDQGRKIAQIQYVGRDSLSREWIPYYKKSSELGSNASGYDTNVTTEYYWNPSTTQWDAASRSSYELYKNSNYIKSKLDQQWVDSLKSWKNTRLTLIDKDDARHFYSYELSTWIESSATWQGRQKYEYVTNEQGSQYLSYTQYFWDAELFQWADKYIESYNAQGQLSSYEEYRLDTDGLSWIGVSRYDQEYDGDITTFIYYIWNNSAWQASDKAESAYDVNNMQTHDAVYRWDQNSADWIGLYKTEAKFDQNRDTTQSIHYIWNRQQSNWLPETRFEYGYLAPGLCDWETLYLWTETGEWVQVSSLKSFFYPNDEDELEIIGWIEYAWDLSGNELLLEQWYKDYPDSEWLPNYTWKRTLLYNENKQIIEQVNYEWDAEQQAMMYTSRSDCSYTDLGQLSSITQYVWNGDHWDEIYTSTYYYTRHANELTKSNISIVLKTYPNPAKASLNISGTHTGQQILLLDLNGKQLGSYAACDQRTEINISSLDNGIYLLNVEGESIRVIKE